MISPLGQQACLGPESLNQRECCSRGILSGACAWRGPDQLGISCRAQPTNMCAEILVERDALYLVDSGLLLFARQGQPTCVLEGAAVGKGPLPIAQLPAPVPGVLPSLLGQPLDLLETSLCKPKLNHEQSPPVYLKRPRWKRVPCPWRSCPRHCPRYSRAPSPLRNAPSRRSPATQMPS